MTTSFKNVVNHCVVYCVFAAIVFASSKFVAHMLIKSSNLDSAQCAVNVYDPTINESRMRIEPPTPSNTQIVRFDYSCDIRRTFVTCLIEYLAFALVFWICSYLPCMMKKNKNRVQFSDEIDIYYFEPLSSRASSNDVTGIDEDRRIASEAPTSNASIAAIDPDSNPVLAAFDDAVKVKDRTIQNLTSERDELLKKVSEIEELNKLLCNEFSLQQARRNMACTSD